MNERDQKLAIYKACGITVTEVRTNGSCWGHHPDKPTLSVTRLPDPLEDRNFMAEVVGGDLTTNQKHEYARYIQEGTGLFCVGRVGDYNDHLRNLAKLTCVHPRHMAKAFLKARGEWTE